MTIHLDDIGLWAECNECGEAESGGALEFADFIQRLKDSGWRIRKDGDEWFHTCPDCQD